MVFGHNTNVIVGAVSYHVQTEDRGTNSCLLETTVYFQGRILHRRTSNYSNLLPIQDGQESVLKARLDQQHRQVLDEIRAGDLKLPVAEKPTASVVPEETPPPQDQALVIELLNSKNWRNGQRASLHLAVRDNAGVAVEGAKISARIVGATELVSHKAQTSGNGEARIEFTLPKLTEREHALIIEACSEARSANLQFQLRAAPRAPSAEITENSQPGCRK